LSFTEIAKVADRAVSVDRADEDLVGSVDLEALEPAVLAGRVVPAAEVGDQTKVANDLNVQDVLSNESLGRRKPI
jgi:hypothetical protein